MWQVFILVAKDYFFSSTGLSDLKKSLIELVVESQAELIDAHPVKHSNESMTTAKM